MKSYLDIANAQYHRYDLKDTSGRNMDRCRIVQIEQDIYAVSHFYNSQNLRFEISLSKLINLEELI